jgi:hypothetical protein
MALTSIVSAGVLTAVLGCACATLALKKMVVIAAIDRMKKIPLYLFTKGMSSIELQLGTTDECMQSYS